MDAGKAEGSLCLCHFISYTVIQHFQQALIHVEPLMINSITAMRRLFIPPCFGKEM